MSVLAGSSRRTSSLPRALTPLQGRVREAEEIRSLLLRQAYRLVTIVGPGGVGKTRLALHVADSLMEAFDEQVVFVPLAAIHDPAHVLPAIGQAAGVFGDVRETMEERLVGALADERMLLVLDNFEQVGAAAPVLGELLGRCPGLTILATSQASLGIAGEQLYPLEPLATPGTEAAAPGEILRADAVALFVQRARAVNPALAVDERSARTIAEICRRLDGLPLAIELAAARTAILSPEALLARLNNRLQVLGGTRQDVPDRLRTMRNAVAWSYELLRPGEQGLFRRLAVFAGGFSLEATEAVCPPVDDGRETFDVLTTLVDRSMVKPLALPSGEPRFLMLETLRAYGQEQLAARGEEQAARQAHASFFVGLGEVAEPHLVGSEQQAWLERLDPEVENFRAAIDWAMGQGSAELALRIAGATWRFWSLRGRTPECRAWLERSLAAAPDAPVAHRAKALVGLGHLSEDQRDLDASRASFERALALAIEAGDLVTASRARHGLGLVAHDSGDYDVAMEHHTAAVELARQAGDRRSLANGLGSMGAVAYYRGDLDAAERSWEEALEIFTALGDVTTEAILASNLGAAAAEQGDIARAERLQQRALAQQRRMNLLRDLPHTLINLGEIYRKLGDYTLSHDCFAEAIHLLREQGIGAIEGVALHGFAKLRLLQNDIPGAATMALESTQLLAAAGDQLGVIEDAELTALVAVTAGRHAEAVELAGAATSLRAQIGSTRHPVTEEEMRDIDARARAALSDEAHAAAWAAGAGLTHDALVRRIGIIAREIVGTRQPSPLPAAPVASAESPEPVAVEHPLTPREVEVLRLLAKGHSTREVAEMLFISPRTAGTHINNILGKLDMPSRTAAVAYAMRTGIV